MPIFRPEHDGELPAEIRELLPVLAGALGVDREHLVVASADHEQLNHPDAYSIGCEGGPYYWPAYTAISLPGYWKEALNHCCVALYPDPDCAGPVSVTVDAEAAAAYW